MSSHSAQILANSTIATQPQLVRPDVTSALKEVPPQGATLLASVAHSQADSPRLDQLYCGTRREEGCCSAHTARAAQLVHYAWQHITKASDGDSERPQLVHLLSIALLTVEAEAGATSELIFRVLVTTVVVTCNITQSTFQAIESQTRNSTIFWSSYAGI